MEKRRQIIKTGILVTLGMMVPKISIQQSLNQKSMQDRPAPLAPPVVHEFVANAHGNFQKVKDLLEEHPGLINASWDWGGGDFETALNAAGHTGNVDIAEFLISRGARMDIFCAAMLGKLDIVKSILTAYPNLKTSKGPHGLMLIHHAQKGESRAVAVLNYLNDIGAS